MIPTKKNKDLENKKWNAENDTLKGKVNEGFSGQYLSEDYNPSKGKLKTEIEKDTEGKSKIVKRARDVENYDTEATTTGEVLKSKKNPENRDKNYDVDPNRYSSSNPESKRDRGNMKLDNE